MKLIGSRKKKEQNEHIENFPYQMDLDTEMLLIPLTGLDGKVIFINAARISSIDRVIKPGGVDYTRVSLDKNDPYFVSVRETPVSIVDLIQKASVSSLD